MNESAALPLDDEENSEGSGSFTPITQSMILDSTPQAKKLFDARLANDVTGPSIGGGSGAYITNTTDYVFHTSESLQDVMNNPPDEEASSATISAPILAVVAIIAFVTILLFFALFVRYFFCHKASYYVNESHELKPLKNGNGDQFFESTVAGNSAKEYLV